MHDQVCDDTVNTLSLHLAVFEKTSPRWMIKDYLI